MSDEDPGFAPPGAFAPPGGGAAPPPPPPPPEQPPAPGWWKASDGNWYPPQPDPAVPPSGAPAWPPTAPPSSTPAWPPTGPPTQAPPTQAPAGEHWTPPPIGHGAGHPGTAPDGSLYYAPGAGGAPSRGLATWSLVLGILSILGFWTCGLGVLLGILAVIFGAMGRNRARENGSADGGRAQAGLVTGVIGIVGGVLFLVWAATALLPDVLDEVEAELDDGICEPDLESFDPDC